jgi:hypothetical protein
MTCVSSVETRGWGAAGRSSIPRTDTCDFSSHPLRSGVGLGKSPGKKGGGFEFRHAHLIMAHPKKYIKQYSTHV